MSGDGKRSIDVSIDIEADVDTVWTAISDAEQLRRWFPLDAAVEPGVGGSISLSWGPDIQGTAPIQVWEPGRRLVWAERWGGEGDEPGVPVAVDIRIESVGGVTRLRLVHSGFDDDARWDDFLDTLDSGWRYFLFNLKHYLERHRGRPRTMVWDRRKVSGDRAEVWARLLRTYGIDTGTGTDTDTPAIGSAADLWGAAPAEVVQLKPTIHLALSIEQLDGALLLVELEPGAGTFSLGTWLSLYGEAGEHAARLGERLGAVYDRAFPPANEQAS